MNFHSKAKKNQKRLSNFMQYTTFFDIKAAKYCRFVKIVIINKAWNFLLTKKGFEPLTIGLWAR